MTAQISIREDNDLNTLTASRLKFVAVPPARPQMLLKNVVAEGLNRADRCLPCCFFYDAVGSDLFEQICDLPEYYLTRTERAILDRYAPEIVEAAGENLAMVEYGSGSSVKTRLLLSAALDRQSELHYIPIDISGDFLRESAHGLLAAYDRLRVTAIAAEYGDAGAAVPRHHGPRLFLFLGSNIGNFDRDGAVSFLKDVRRVMQPQDRILLGVDLLKDSAIIEAAYNDAQGVTAKFNKNLLTRINAELDADFDLNRFDHAAPFVEEHDRIEMRLVSRKAQEVRVGALNRTYRFAAGETIHTENSHKHCPNQFRLLCRTAGLEIQEQWRDARDWFSVLLLRPS